MADNDWKSRLGTVYSTNPDFKYTSAETEAVDTPAPERQNLRVSLDRRNRGGKQVTLIAGFVGSAEELEKLAKLLKTRLGVGGAAKDGKIIIQGDFRSRVIEILKSQGYAKTK